MAGARRNGNQLAVAAAKRESWRNGGGEMAKNESVMA